VILARANRHTFSLADFDAASFQVILEDLVCALAYLPLAIELEATAENVQFVVVGDCGVALAALDLLLTLEVYFLPDHLVAHNLGAHDLFNRLLVHSADHVRWVALAGESGGFAWWRNPDLPLRLGGDLSSEALTLLHALDERLDASGELLRELIAWDIIGRVRSERTTWVIDLLLRVNHEQAMLRPTILTRHHLELSVHRERLVSRGAEETRLMQDSVDLHIRGLQAIAEWDGLICD
jgi:hypothetical protein